MKLTPAEKAICQKYSAYDKSGHVRCNLCPLMISEYYLLCYANIDGRTREAKELKRYIKEERA